jgi:hypothetical protein
MKKDSFATIWNGWRYRVLRWRIHSPLPPISCRKCFVNWGINGGNAGNVMAQEGLLIKAWYWLEYRILGIAARWQHWRNRKAPPVGHDNPEGLAFYRGKPMSERNRPTA